MVIGDAALADEVARLAEVHGIPGFAVGVVHGGRSSVATAGVTSTADPLAVTPETLFHIGSTTKTLTATALMAVVQSGSLGLDDLVSGLLPDLARADWLDLTLGMLLNHTAGFRGDAVFDTGWGDDALARAAEQIGHLPQVVPPGQLMSYSNAAFGLAGRILELATGETYEAAVSRLVLDPLGLDNTFLLPWQAVNRRMAVGHHPGDGGMTPLPGWPMPRSGNPFGGAVSPVLDQVAYARFHLSGGPVVADATRLLMQQPTVEVRSGISGVGVGWLLKRHRGTPLVTHGGNVNNLHVSTFVLAPEHGIAVTTLANSAAGNVAGDAVLDWVLDRAGLPPDPLLPVLPPRAEYVGRYDAGQWFQEVTLRDGKLFIAMVLPETSDDPPEIRALFNRPPVEVTVVGDDLLALAARPTAAVGDFIRRDDGSIGWLRFGLRLAGLVPEQRTD